MTSLFHWLVQYHCDHNLLNSLEFFREGRVYSSQHHPIAEGQENRHTSGHLIIANGDTLAERLQENGIILDRHAPVFEPVSSSRDLSHFLSQNEDMDGAFIYDGKNQRMARVSKIANSSPALKEARQQQPKLIPNDFIHSQGAKLTDEYLDQFIGTRTDLAITLPVAYSTPASQVHSYIVKMSGYTPLGMGKVAHFSSEGLREEFFFRHEPGVRGMLDNPQYPILGVQRSYIRREGELILLSESLLPEQVYGKAA